MPRPGDPDLHGAAAAVFLPHDGDPAVPCGVRAERDRLLRGGGGLHGHAEFPDTVGLKVRMTERV